MEAEKKHVNRVNLRLTDEEYNAIIRYINFNIPDEGERSNKRNFSEAIRSLLRNAIENGIQERPKQPCIDSKLAHDIRAELRKIGTNVNQLTAKINSVFKESVKMYGSTENKLIKSLEMVSQHLEDIHKRVVELGEE